MTTKFQHLKCFLFMSSRAGSRRDSPLQQTTNRVFRSCSKPHQQALHNYPLSRASNLENTCSVGLMGHGFTRRSMAGRGVSLLAIPFSCRRSMLWYVAFPLHQKGVVSQAPQHLKSSEMKAPCDMLVVLSAQSDI